MQLKSFATLIRTKHRNVGPLLSKCESHFDPRRRYVGPLRRFTGCYAAIVA